MVDQTTKEKGEGMHEESRELSLDDRMEGLNLRGEEEDLDFSAELDELVKDAGLPFLGFILQSHSVTRPCSVQ